MDDNTAQLPVKEPAPDRTTQDSLESLRETRPDVCHSCGMRAPSTSQFCPSCETFLRDPWVGRLASTKRRLVAAWLDSTFKDGGVFGYAVWSVVVPPGIARTIMACLATVYAIGSLYLWSKGTTPAKRVLGMRVVSEDGEPASFWQMAGRETIGKWISAAVLGLGFLSIPFDKERRGWHDKMMKTWVVRENDE